jgi:spectrin alpha
MKKHQALLAELAGHEGRITAVCSQGDQMVKEGHFAGEDITRKVQELQEKWNNLKVYLIIITELTEPLYL